MPKPHPIDDVSRENLTRLLEDLSSLSELVREISATIPLLAVAKARLRITLVRARIHRMIDAIPDDMPEVIGPAAYVPEAATLSAEEDPIDLPEFQRRGVTEAFRTHLFSIAAEEYRRHSRRKATPVRQKP
jgi:hypothetical protein